MPTPYAAPHPDPLAALLRLMTDHGHAPSDVRWVGQKDGTLALPWAEAVDDLAAFLTARPLSALADELEGVVVVGDGWWIEREVYGDYDGWWWVYAALPVRAAAARPFRFPATEAEWGLLDRDAPVVAPVHAESPCRCGATRVIPDGPDAGMCYDCGATPPERLAPMPDAAPATGF